MNYVVYGKIQVPMATHSDNPLCRIGLLPSVEPRDPRVLSTTMMLNPSELQLQTLNLGGRLCVTALYTYTPWTQTWHETMYNQFGDTLGQRRRATSSGGLVSKNFIMGTICSAAMGAYHAALGLLSRDVDMVIVSIPAQDIKFCKLFDVVFAPFDCGYHRMPGPLMPRRVGVLVQPNVTEEYVAVALFSSSLRNELDRDDIEVGEVLYSGTLCKWIGHPDPVTCRAPNPFTLLGLPGLATRTEKVGTFSDVITVPSTSLGLEEIFNHGTCRVVVCRAESHDQDPECASTDVGPEVDVVLYSVPWHPVRPDICANIVFRPFTIAGNPHRVAPGPYLAVLGNWTNVSILPPVDSDFVVVAMLSYQKQKSLGRAVCGGASYHEQQVRILPPVESE